MNDVPKEIFTAFRDGTTMPFHAYLITSSDKQALMKKAVDLSVGIFALRSNAGEETLRTRIASCSFSDLMVISKDASAVKIDQVRKLNEFFSYQASEGGYKIVIINDAETMGDAAQNALLKTLEEPIDNRVVILLAENTDNLLPTVLSRVQSLNIDGSDIKILLCEDEKNFLCDKIEKVILAGDIEELFLLSDRISKERVKALSYLEYLYAYICIRSDQKFGRDVAYAMGAHIKEAIIRIRQNSSVILTVQALLIRLQEEYNAKNSRDSL